MHSFESVTTIVLVPVYFFSFHAYRSWMPDHPRGYTKRKKGYLPPDPEMARNYARRAKENESVFSDAVVKALLEQFLEACPHIDCRFHGGGSDPTHIHGLVSWKHRRGWMSIRKSLKTSLTKRLNTLDEHVAFSRGASRKHVRHRGHFQHLLRTYLPDHRGWAYYEDRGFVYQKGTKPGGRRK